MTAFIIAAAQYPVEEMQSFARWQDKAAQWVAEAKAGGAALALFPEYGMMELTAVDPRARNDLAYSLSWLAEQQEEINAVWQQLAAEHGLHICAPSMPVFGPNGSYRNEARLFAPNGKSGAQQKRVMTRFEREIWGVSGSEELCVFDTALGKIGIAICYDSEFPLIARTMAEAGAEMILVPSATDSMAGYWRVRLGAQARALENQYYVIHSPTVGDAPWCPSLDENHGAAGVYGPPDLGFPETGVVALGEMDQPAWLFADIDLSNVARVRAEGDVFNHRHWDEQPGLPQLSAQIVDLI